MRAGLGKVTLGGCLGAINVRTVYVGAQKTVHATHDKIDGFFVHILQYKNRCERSEEVGSLFSYQPFMIWP